MEIEWRPSFYWWINRPPNPLEVLGPLLGDALTNHVAAQMRVGRCQFCGAVVPQPHDFHICPTRMFRNLWRPTD